MLFNVSAHRFASSTSGLTAAVFLIAFLLLCGCFFRTDLPHQPPAQPSPASDPPAKSSPRSPHADSASQGKTADDSGKLPGGSRTMLLHGNWYRIPSATAESATAVYAKAESAAPSSALSTRFRFHNAGLEQVMARPAEERKDLPELMADSNRIVAATAAIALARQGDQKAAPRLITAVNDDQLPLPARCAAVEALGQLPGTAQVESLGSLADRYGQFIPGASTGYQADLHAELLRALARHVDAADDSRFTAAAQVPSTMVRLEALRAWAASKHGLVPVEIADLRSDDDPRVRAAALTALAARKVPQAFDYLSSALHDVNLDVRLAAIRGFVQLDDAPSRATLSDLLQDRAELIRAEAVAAIAVRGSQSVVLGAAGDKSWRVRLKVAQALAGYANPEGAAACRQLLHDHSAEVERQVVRSLAAWPLEKALPVLFEALSRDAASVRRLAADQIAVRWPGGSRFPYEAQPTRRAEALAALQERFRREFTGSMHDAAVATAGYEAASRPVQPKIALNDDQVEKLAMSANVKALIDLGPAVVAALQRLAIDRQLTLPEPVYREVLPHYDMEFAALDRMRSGNVDQRRRAAEELIVAAKKRPLGELAIARLCEIVTTETDAYVWLGALEAAANNGSEPAVRMARAALSEKDAQVRRQGCIFLAAHPDPAHEAFLKPLLNDPDQDVAIAAIRALAASSKVADMAALKGLLASANESIRLETAIALVHFHEPAGDDAIERLSYSTDLKSRARVAQALGRIGEMRFVPILIRLLDDPRATVNHAALASLPRLVGHDISQPGDGVTVPAAEQIERWKKWYAASHH